MTEARRRHASGGTAKSKSISEKEGRSAAGRRNVPVAAARKPLVRIFLGLSTHRKIEFGYSVFQYIEKARGNYPPKKTFENYKFIRS